ncbi:hypothetical protein L6164_027752 [Bauhinia variegata]|uniref:Uncharacterized protein n=1 Tax=Bauhinia variegata TaxID=167791 RepID=A0ACB9LU98_BAUVA|nr:hypothetical protein L6164_027752 [Bauhinia variegata]
MAEEKILKPSKWFSNKSLRLSLHRRRSRSRSRSSNSTLGSDPVSPCTPKYGCREEELREVFRHFDGNGDGKISALELRTYFGSIGECLSQEEAQGVIHDLDSDGDNLLDFEDFTRLMKREGSEDDDLRKAFEMFVWEKDTASACITPKGLQHMLHRLGDDKSYDECVAMIDAFDVDHNGVLDFNEFHQMMAA